MNELPVPKIRATFVIAGEAIDFGYVTKSLGVSPSETRSINEWPEPPKNYDMPECFKPHEEWIYETKRTESWAISLEVDKIIEVFGEKAEIIRELCKKFELTTTVSLSVHMAGEINPELCLDRPAIDFLSAIGADFGIDLYIYAEADGGIKALESIELE